MAFLFENTHVEWTPHLIGALTYLVLGNLLIAITLLLALTRAGKVSQVASLFFFVPPGAALMSYLVLGIAVLGVAIATWKGRG